MKLKLFFCVLVGVVTLCTACTPMTYTEYVKKKSDLEQNYTVAKSMMRLPGLSCLSNLYGDYERTYLAVLQIRYERDKETLQYDKQKALEEWQQRSAELADKIAAEEDRGKRQELTKELQSVKREIQFFQEAESAAEADKKMQAVSIAKIAASAFFARASSHYREAASYERQGNTAYEKGNFEDAARLFSSAVTSFLQALGDFVPYYFVKVEAGSFKRKEQQVTLTKPFYIGKYEVTQAQWKVVMGNNPSHFKGDNRPVENVSWNGAMEFCKKLNDLGLAPAGYKFSLPTEAQWEFAARGGNLSKGYEYSGSNDINEVAWYTDNFGSQTHDVGGKKPNELGLYDMSGNVLEWCLDWYDDYSNSAVTDPQGPQRGSYRVMRGGSWLNVAFGCRVASRSFRNPDYRRSSDGGFRLALVPVQ